MQLAAPLARIISLHSRWTHILVLLIFYGSAIVIFVSDALPLQFHLDAYYYFTIAGNLSEGAGLTFDGVSTTTGFHPLWLVILTLLHFVFHGIAGFQVAVYVLLAIFFVSGHLLLTNVAVRIGISLNAFILASAIVFLTSLNTFQIGVENTLLFFLLSLFLWIQCQHWRSGTLFAAANAFVLLFIYLARLDSIFTLALISAWFLYSGWRSRRFTAGMFIPIVLGISVLIHWLIMIAAFDTIFPTSQIAIRDVISAESTLLNSFKVQAHPLTQRIIQVGQMLPVMGKFLLWHTGLSVPIGVLIATGILALRRSTLRWVLVMVGLSELILISYYALFLNGYTRPWYYTGTYVVLSLGLGSLLSTILKNSRSLLLAAAVSPIIVASLLLNYGQTHIGWSYYYERAKLIENYDQGNNVLVGFTPDLAAYFSQVPIRHLEGAANGYDFLNQYAVPARVTTYLRDINATHLIVSNHPVLPKFIPCATPISFDSGDGSMAYGTYDTHNSYIAVYTISIAPGMNQEFEDLRNRLCGPASG